MERKLVWEVWDEKQRAEADAFAAEYCRFLSRAKTERECVDEMTALAEEKGYRNIREYIGSGRRLCPGDKVYASCMNKTLALFQIGSHPMENGMNILGAHIDSPRLDVKQNPLFEESGLAYLDTHYYGGIKKYQWVALPLALHGVIVKKDGTTVKVAIGEKEDEPVFFVSDLLIHMAQKQMERKASEVIDGEALDLIVGSRPLSVKPNEEEENKNGAGRDAVKAGILKILKDTYGIEEEDFLSAELEIVPAGQAREAGLDRSMILAYGQDDRVCAYASLMAMLYSERPQRTSCCLLVDKEEIGSVGATGMESRFFENTVAEVMNLTGEYSEMALRRCLSSSCMLSSDVGSAFDPNYASCYDKRNAAHLGAGMLFNKFTGSRGKSGSNDANAEYVAQIRRIMDDAGVQIQTAEIGKVDVGGGGTIAYITSLYGMEVIDCGVPVLSMHAPWEATSKADIYETMRGYLAFLCHAGEKKE